MKLSLRDQVIESYKVQVYSDNILDCLYKIEHAKLSSYFEKTKKACMNFKNRMFAKGNKRPDDLLELIFEDKHETEKFEKYRDTINKAVNYCLNIHPDDYPKLNKMIDCQMDKDLFFMTEKQLREIVIQSRLDTSKIDDFMNKIISSNKK